MKTNTKSKKQLKIVACFVAAITLIAIVNILMYNVSFADQRTISVKADDTGFAAFCDDTGILDDGSWQPPDIFGSTENIDLVLDANHPQSDVSNTILRVTDKVGLINYKYKISNIYMDTSPENPNNLRVFYKTWNDDRDLRVDYSFRVHFDLYTKDGKFIVGQGDETEWRPDWSDNDHKLDKLVFNSTDKTDFQDMDGHYFGCTLHDYLVGRLVDVMGEDASDLWNMSLRDLIANGYVKITLNAVYIDT